MSSASGMCVCVRVRPRTRRDNGETEKWREEFMELNLNVDVRLEKFAGAGRSGGDSEWRGRRMQGDKSRNGGGVCCGDLTSEQQYCLLWVSCEGGFHTVVRQSGDMDFLSPLLTIWEHTLTLWLIFTNLTHKNMITFFFILKIAFWVNSFPFLMQIDADKERLLSMYPDTVLITPGQ